MQKLYDDELMHYGVLGMRWGVRRASRSSGGRKSSGSSRSGKVAKTTGTKAVSTSKAVSSTTVKVAKSAGSKVKSHNESKKQSKSESSSSSKRVIDGHDSILPGKMKLKDVRKNVNKMSDQELQSHINRLRNEEAYYRLKGFDDKTIKRLQKGRSAQTSAFVTQFSEVATSEVAKTVSKAVVAGGMAYVTKRAKDKYVPRHKA